MNRKAQQDELECALRIMIRAHEGQVDKGGSAYVLHPLRLMAKAQTHEERVVCLLHDVIEDGGETVATLIASGISADAAERVQVLTRLEDETYADMIERVASNSVCRAVKILDLEDNMDLSRLQAVTDEDISRQKRYERALARLKAAS